MKNIFLLYILLLISSFELNASIMPTEKQLGHIVKKEINYKEENINYFIYIPKNHKKVNKDKEIILIFHGNYSKSEDFLNKTNLANELKNKDKSFIVFESSANNWFSHKSKNEKDKLFIEEMFNYINDRFNKITLIGYSTGGTLINELLCKSFAKKISRVIVNNSSVTKNDINCKIKNLDYIFIAGSLESYYGFDKKNNEEYLSILESKEYIRRNLDCTSDFISLEIEKEISDNTFAQQYVHNCNQKNGNKFQYIQIEGMGNNFINTVSDDILELKDFEGLTNKDIKIIEFIK